MPLYSLQVVPQKEGSEDVAEVAHDGPRLVRTSERTTFKRCQQRWWWSYVDGYGPRGIPNQKLWFGTGIHLCLAEWYGKGTKREVHPLETWEAFTKDSMVKMRVYFDKGQGVESEWVDAVELGKAMLTAYLEEYGEDESWDFIATEKTGQAKIRVPFGTSGMILYSYTYDGVYRDLDDGLIKLLETKTTAGISTGHLTLDDQAGSYWMTASAELRKAGVLTGGQRIAGVNYNFLRKGFPDSRPRHPRTGEACNQPTREHFLVALEPFYTEPELKKMKVPDLKEAAETLGLKVYGEISKTQPSPLFERFMVMRTTKERNTQIRRIQQEAHQMQLLLDGVMEPMKTPRSTGHDACHFGCEFFQMCELHEAGLNWEDLRDATMKKRDPYEGYAKSAHAAS
jgi:hypothetical protein